MMVDKIQNKENDKLKDSNIEVTNIKDSNIEVTNIKDSNIEVTNIKDSNTTVSTILNQFSGVFEVSVSNVSNSNLTQHTKNNKRSCYIYVSNLSTILNLLTNPTNVLIIYTLSNIPFVYYNMFYKILKIDLIKIKRALYILEREGIIISTQRNESTLSFLEHLSTQKTVGQYHINKIIFYQLNNHYKPFFDELMRLWEKELPDYILKSVQNYKYEIRKTREGIDKLKKAYSKEEQTFVLESANILKDKPYCLDGRVRLYNSTFGQNLTKTQFQFRLSQLVTQLK